MTDANIDSRGLSWIGSMKMRGAGLEPAFLAERDFKSVQRGALEALSATTPDESAEKRRDVSGIDATTRHPVRHPARWSDALCRFFCDLDPYELHTERRARAIGGLPL